MVEKLHPKEPKLNSQWRQMPELVVYKRLERLENDNFVVQVDEVVERFEVGEVDLAEFVDGFGHFVRSKKL